jgi:hypothetical protein
MSFVAPVQIGSTSLTTQPSRRQFEVARIGDASPIGAAEVRGFPPHSDAQQIQHTSDIMCIARPCAVPGILRRACSRGPRWVTTGARPSGRARRGAVPTHGGAPLIRYRADRDGRARDAVVQRAVRGSDGPLGRGDDPPLRPARQRQLRVRDLPLETGVDELPRQRCTRAPAPLTRARTSANVAEEVSPGVVIARAP